MNCKLGRWKRLDFSEYNNWADSWQENLKNKQHRNYLSSRYSGEDVQRDKIRRPSAYNPSSISSSQAITH